MKGCIEPIGGVRQIKIFCGGEEGDGGAGEVHTGVKGEGGVQEAGAKRDWAEIRHLIGP